MTLTYIRPDADDVDGGWRDSSNGTTLWDKLDDNWWLSGASIDLWFEQDVYYDGSNADIDPTTFLSCSRASSGYVTNADGTLTSFGSNVLRIGVGTGLLVEDARTNLHPSSQDFSNTSYWITGAATGSAPTLTADQIAAPDGTTTADKLTNHSAASTYPAMQSFSSISLGAGTVYTLTQYYKLGAGVGPFVLVSVSDFIANSASGVFNLSTGAVDSSGTSGDGTIDGTNIEALANGWYRCVVSFHFTAAHNMKAFNSGALSNNSGACIANDFCYMWGAQLEAGSFASSYIPTTTASATRAADVVTCIGNLNTVMSGAANSCIVDAQLYAGLNLVGFIRLIGIAASDSTYLAIGTDEFTVNAYDLSVGLGATSPISFKNGAKAGYSMDGSGRSIVGGGGTVVTDSHGATISGATILKGKLGAAPSEDAYGYCRRLTAWNSRLADATLQTLTQTNLPLDDDYIAGPGIVTDLTRIRLSDPSGAVTQPATVRYRYKKRDNDLAQQVDFMTMLLQGSTEVASWRDDDIDSAAFATQSRVLTSGEFAAITDFTDLFLEFIANPWWLSDSTIDLDFQNGRYFDSTNFIYGRDQATLLLHFDGADASTTLFDATGRQRGPAFSGTGQIDTAQSKFGGASALFPGTSNNGITFPTNLSDLAFGTGDFTIDFWIRPNGFPASLTELIAAFDISSNEQAILFDNNGFIFYYWSVFGIAITSGAAITNAVWTHIALTRASGSTKLFINGVQSGSTYTDSNNYAAWLPNTPLIAPNIFAGWIDELRILVGTAAWSTTFTPPTSAYKVPLAGPYSLLSISRASTGYAQTQAGTLTSFGTNTLRITDNGLLVEDARTNLAIDSQTLNNWPTQSSITVTVDNTIAPDGTTTADLLTGTASGNQHIDDSFISVSINVPYAISVYVKPNAGGNDYQLGLTDGTSNSFQAVFTLTGNGSNNGGTTTGATTISSLGQEALANGWYRCWIVGQSTAWVSNTAKIALYLWTGFEAAWAWGAQVEQASFVSSYIPTTTTSATRAVDQIICAGHLDTLIRGTDVSAVVASLFRRAQAGLIGTDLAGILLGIDDGAQYASIYNGTGWLRDGDLSSFDNQVSKIASSWNAAGISVVGNDNPVATSVGSLFPNYPGFALSNIYLGQWGSGGGAPKVWVTYKRLTAWNKRLEDNTLRGLTAS